MLGTKTLVVGGAAVAVVWMMNTHASAGDLANTVKNGSSPVSGGYQGLQNAYQSLQNGGQSTVSQHGTATGGAPSPQDVLKSLGTSTGGGPETSVGSGVGVGGAVVGAGVGTGVAGGAGTSGSGLSGPAVELIPSAARPGQQVLITVPTCIQPETGTATSVVFTNNGSVSLTRNPRGAGLAGTATIVPDAQNGQWSVNITCGTGANSVNGVTSITIYDGIVPTPIMPPRAGGGGSVMKGDMGMTAGGVALVAGGVAYGLWTMRRRGVDGPYAG